MPPQLNSSVPPFLFNQTIHHQDPRHIASASIIRTMLPGASWDAFHWAAIDAAMGEGLRLKEKAQRLQHAGNYEAALPLMLQSVSLRENSHTLCLSLS